MDSILSRWDDVARRYFLPSLETMMQRFERQGDGDMIMFFALFIESSQLHRFNKTDEDRWWALEWRELLNEEWSMFFLESIQILNELFEGVDADGDYESNTEDEMIIRLVNKYPRWLLEYLSFDLEEASDLDDVPEHVKERILAKNNTNRARILGSNSVALVDFLIKHGKLAYKTLSNYDSVNLPVLVGVARHRRTMDHAVQRGIFDMEDFTGLHIGMSNSSGVINELAGMELYFAWRHYFQPTIDCEDAMASLADILRQEEKQRTQRFDFGRTVFMVLHPFAHLALDANLRDPSDRLFMARVLLVCDSFAHSDVFTALKLVRGIDDPSMDWLRRLDWMQGVLMNEKAARSFVGLVLLYAITAIKT